MLLKYLLIFLTLEPINRLTKNHNNVCKKFKDYYFPDNNENCYFDPDTTIQTPQLIKKYSGIVETHKIISDDGYITTMYRIPKKNPKGVILLHHSIATYSHIYLFESNNSLALTLWRNGYDVWLANQRGTFESNQHVNLTSYDFAYWDFSFHEMALYDVSKELELIREQSNGSQVIFFGHSLGSAVGLIYSILKPIEAKKYLKTMILLAPPVYFRYATSLIYYFTGIMGIIWEIIKFLHIGSPLIFLPWFFGISRFFLRIFPIFLFVTNLLIWAFCGYTPAETNPTFFNYDAIIYNNNFSWKTLMHFTQLVNSDRFQMFDYGEKENLKIYGNKIPTEYQLENNKVPTLLVSSYNDTLISVKDNELIYEKFGPEARIHNHWKLSDFNHLDYHIGLHRNELFVKRLLQFLNNL